jgi:hypothetical protein
MGKMFGILVIIVGLWAGAEIYNNGTAQAFGGILATLGLAEAAPQDAEPQSLGRRAGSKVGRSHADADARRERLLAE